MNRSKIAFAFFANLRQTKSEGTMSLSKPDAGWPVGKYRVELYVGDELKLKVPFTIQN